MLLSVGKFVFILDKRVEVVEQPNMGDWILVIKVSFGQETSRCVITRGLFVSSLRRMLRNKKKV
jgi:hypothetical protein